MLRNIGVEKGDDYVNEREHRGAKTIANHLTLLTTMLNAATTFKTNASSCIDFARARCQQP